MKGGNCKSCKKHVKVLTKGYCQSCYRYFIRDGYDTWYPSQYGELGRVQDKNSNQYGMPICHICGKAFTKLQQHIYYAHNLSKKEYCDKFGIDRSINMTRPEYNEKMRNYALKNNMNEQLRQVGKDTRFKKGHNNKYKRSYQTVNRLKNMQKEYVNKHYEYKLRNQSDNWLKRQW